MTGPEAVAHYAQGLSTGGLQGWITDNIVPLVLLGIAIILLWIGGRGDNAGVARRSVGAGGPGRSAHVRIGSPVRPTKRAERRAARGAPTQRATAPARAAHARSGGSAAAAPPTTTGRRAAGHRERRDRGQG